MTINESLRELRLAWRRVKVRFWLAVGHGLVVVGTHAFEHGRRLMEMPDD